MCRLWNHIRHGAQWMPERIVQSYLQQLSLLHVKSVQLKMDPFYPHNAALRLVISFYTLADIILSCLYTKFSILTRCFINITRKVQVHWYSWNMSNPKQLLSHENRDNLLGYQIASYYSWMLCEFSCMWQALTSTNVKQTNLTCSVQMQLTNDRQPPVLTALRGWEIQDEWL